MYTSPPKALLYAFIISLPPKLYSPGKQRSTFFHHNVVAFHFLDFCMNMIMQCVLYFWSLLSLIIITLIFTHVVCINSLLLFLLLNSSPLYDTLQFVHLLSKLSLDISFFDFLMILFCNFNPYCSLLIYRNKIHFCILFLIFWNLSNSLLDLTLLEII